MNRERSWRTTIKRALTAAALGAAVIWNPAERVVAQVPAQNTEMVRNTASQAERRALRLIFVHGWQGGGTSVEERDDTWVDSVKDFTQQNGIDSAYPDLPGGVRPRSGDWKQRIKEEVEYSDNKDVILMGYSLGSRASLLFIQACLDEEPGYSKELLDKIKVLVLVAPFNNNMSNATRRDGAYSDFFDIRVDTNRIAEVVPVRRALHSENDRQIPVEQGQEIARELRAPIRVDRNGRGHFYKKEDGAVIIEVLEEAIRTYSQISGS